MSIVVDITAELLKVEVISDVADINSDGYLVYKDVYYNSDKMFKNLPRHYHHLISYVPLSKPTKDEHSKLDENAVKQNIIDISTRYLIDYVNSNVRHNKNILKRILRSEDLTRQSSGVEMMAKLSGLVKRRDLEPEQRPALEEAIKQSFDILVKVYGEKHKESRHGKGRNRRRY